jgi:hypothetical protein
MSEDQKIANRVMVIMAGMIMMLIISLLVLNYCLIIRSSVIKSIAGNELYERELSVSVVAMR